MKKSMKIMSIMMITIMVLFTMTTMVSATWGDKVNELNAVDLASNLYAQNTAASNSVKTIGNQIIGIITTVGVVVAVVILLVLGIKYMMGSASEKAEYKKTMIPYLVGAVLIFAASAITKVVVNMASSISV